MNLPNDLHVTAPAKCNTPEKRTNGSPATKKTFAEYLAEEIAKAR